MKLIDISPPVDARIGVWPGDTPYSRTVSLDMAAGANLTLSSIRTTVHVGAHADAPSHYTRGGADIASRALDYYLGPCNVVEARVGARRILPRDFDESAITTQRVLVRTDSFRDPHGWNEDFASFSPEAIEWLHAKGVILVGIDTPSVDPFESKELEAHQALARHDMANLEGLVLSDAPAGEYELIALPLRLVDADGSPVRAVLRSRVS